PDVAPLPTVRGHVPLRGLGPALQALHHLLVDYRGPRQDAEPEGQEHGHDGDEVVAERDQNSPRSWSQIWCRNNRKGWDTRATTSMANRAEPTRSTMSRPRTRPLYSRDTPLASMRISPTRSRTRNVLAIHMRPLSRNSRRFPCVPTATISSASLPWARRNEASSLIPELSMTLSGTHSTPM